MTHRWILSSIGNPWRELRARVERNEGLDAQTGLGNCFSALKEYIYRRDKVYNVTYVYGFDVAFGGDSVSTALMTSSYLAKK